MFTVYILRTCQNTLYTGQTNNLTRRLAQHKSKKTQGAKYLRLFDSFELVYTQAFETRAQAMQREAQIKQFSKKKKELLISSGI
jgi:putative endonuclease